MGKKEGFTLIELLVVIAIIALLLSIVMPALQKVKHSARDILCKSNLHSWFYSVNLYTQENDENLWPGYYDNQNSNKSIWWMHALRVYYENIDDIRCCPTAMKIRYTYDQDYGPGWEQEPFTAWGILRDGWWINVDGDYGSYCSNGFVEDKWPEKTTDNPNDGWYEGNFWRKQTNFQNASRVPVLMDGQWIDAWPMPDDPPPPYEDTYWSTSGNHASRYVQNRHGNKENSLFADGMVRSVDLKEFWVLKWHRNYNTAGPWTAAGNAAPADWPEWMESFKTY